MINDDFVDTTIANLKVIGMVPKNGKLCVRKGQLCLDHMQAQSIRRWMNGDSRDTTIMHAKNTLSNAMRIARSIISCNPAKPDDNIANWTLHRLLEEIQTCETGLENLKTTYANDSMMLANLDVIIERRKANMAEIQEFIDADVSYNNNGGGPRTEGATRVSHNPLYNDDWVLRSRNEKEALSTIAETPKEDVILGEMPREEMPRQAVQGAEDDEAWKKCGKPAKKQRD